MSREILQFPPGYEWQYRFLLWIQSFHTARLDCIAHVLSSLGTEWYYIVLLPVLFWSVNRTIGLRLAYAFMFSMFINGWVKDAVHFARPIGFPGIRSSYLSSTGGTSSFPSGHAQGSATVWWMLSLWIRKVWFWALAILIIFAIGISRLYLGLHWPIDVLIGWGLGILLGAIGWGVGRWWTYRQYPFGIRMFFAVAIPGAGMVYHPGPVTLQYACSLAGMGVATLLESRWLGLTMERVVWKRVCVSVIGIGGMVALYLLFQWLLWRWSDGSETSRYLAGLCIRNTLMGVWGTLGAPYVFWKCGLYGRQRPEN